MSDAPERIQVFPNMDCHYGCPWDVRDYADGDELEWEAAVYIRADIHDAEVERLRTEIAILKALRESADLTGVKFTGYAATPDE